ncbi:polysaccharide deacetylase family protein [Helicobacter felis]|uniref:polysaccharide deacetylase family protein n=1 Tax=Helicobacter felis TaxID=214 RepID=UPI000CF13B9D|nr:polysaccharide deacetylase family protein [Helicobacter felis]
MRLVDRLSGMWARHCFGECGVIFLLHKILDRNIPGSSVWDVSMDFLDSFILFLKNSGFSFVSMDEICHLLRNGKSLARVVHFTIDDGLKCAFSNALPVFKSHGVPFTLYICTNCVDCLDIDEEMKNANIQFEKLTWEDIRSLDKEPMCTIGGHTKSHPRLKQLMKEGVFDEIRGAHATLEAHLGKKIYHFAYPYGGSDAVGLREVGIVQELELRSAVTTFPGMLYPKHKDFLACLPRVALGMDFRSHQIRHIRKHGVVLL